MTEASAAGLITNAGNDESTAHGLTGIHTNASSPGSMTAFGSPGKKRRQSSLTLRLHSSVARRNWSPRHRHHGFRVRSDPDVADG